jgi:hypothetical protein
MRDLIQKGILPLFLPFSDLFSLPFFFTLLPPYLHFPSLFKGRGCGKGISSPPLIKRGKVK